METFIKVVIGIVITIGFPFLILLLSGVAELIHNKLDESKRQK